MLAETDRDESEHTFMIHLCDYLGWASIPSFLMLQE